MYTIYYFEIILIRDLYLIFQEREFVFVSSSHDDCIVVLKMTIIKHRSIRSEMCDAWSHLDIARHYSDSKIIVDGWVSL